jgi:hypothetical protein
VNLPCRVSVFKAGLPTNSSATPLALRLLDEGEKICRRTRHTIWGLHSNFGALAQDPI